jgi:hypothetical protein
MFASRRILYRSGLLLLALVLSLGGCRWASGPGDTVETPPRELVEKTFRPGGASPNPGQPPAANNQPPTTSPTGGQGPGR